MSNEETIDDGTWTNCDGDILKEEAEYRSLKKTESFEETHIYRSLNTRSLEGDSRSCDIYIDTEIKEGEPRFDGLRMNVQCENIQVGNNNVLNRNESVFLGSESLDLKHKIDILTEKIEEVNQIQLQIKSQLNDCVPRPRHKMNISKEFFRNDNAENRKTLSNLIDRMDMLDWSLVEMKQILLQMNPDYEVVNVKRKNKRGKLRNGFKRLKQLLPRRRLKTKAVDVVELDDESIYDTITLFAVHFENEDQQAFYERTSDKQLIFRGVSSQELLPTYTAERRYNVLRSSDNDISYGSYDSFNTFTGERSYSVLSSSDDMSYYGSYDSLIDCSNQHFFLPKP